ncbi:MAG: hypothetical protein V3S33_03495 [Gammaproteobacteria bacterium]
MLGKLQMVFMIAVLSGCIESYPPMQCQFERIQGKFDISQQEISKMQNSNRLLVLVTRGDRSFMFRKADIIACKSIAQDEQQGDAGKK